MSETAIQRIRRREVALRIADDAAAERMEAEIEMPTPTAAGGYAGTLRVAKVDSDAAGGGHYYCKIQKIDATNWDKDTAAMVDDPGYAELVIVCNLAEMGTNKHRLSSANTDRLICWQEADDEGNLRWVGVEVFGRGDFGTP